MPTFTFRMPQKDYETLQAMAFLTNKRMAELVREAIIEKVDRFVSDESLERRIDDEANQRKAALHVMRSNASGKAS